MPSLTVMAGERSATPLPDALQLGPVNLIVRDLKRSADWYERALGLLVHDGADGRAELGDGERVSIVLHEDPHARPAGRHAGLYHYALLYPSRQELARALMRLIMDRTPVQGASDHGTHEAIYLPDPDGNGIELAADRPRDQWPTPEEEFGAGGPRPLDIENLMAVVDGEPRRDRVGPGLRMGHVHLHVGSIEDGLAFYRDVIGFDVWARIDSAAFVSAGGYHHHLGFNTWRGEGVGGPSPHTVGLERWTIELGSAGEVAKVRARVQAAGLAHEAAGDGFVVCDPWGTALLVRG